MKTKCLKYSKKLLSVFLSLLMVITSLSVGFVFTATAAGDPIEELANALKNDAVKNLSSYADETDATVYNFQKYADYAALADVLEKLDAAVKASDTFKATHNADNDKSISALKAEIVEKMQGQGYMTADEYASYNVTTLFDKVFSDAGMTKHGGSTNQNQVTSSVSNKITVQTADYQGYLAAVGSYDAIPTSITLGTAYTITCDRQTYRVSESNGCGGTNNTDYYDNCVSKSETSVAATNAEVQPKLAEHKNYVEEKANAGLTFAALVDMTLEEQTALKSELEEKIATMTAYVGSQATYEKLFGTVLADLLSNVNSAIEFAAYAEIADQMNDFVTEHPNYGEFCYPQLDDLKASGQLDADWTEYKAMYDAIVKGGDDVLEYLKETEVFDETYYNNFNDNVVVYVLKETREKADDLYNTYKDTHKDLTLEEQSALYSLLTGYLYATIGYSEQVISAIFETRNQDEGISGYEYLTALAQELYAEINEYVVYFAQKLHTDYNSYKTQAVMDLIAEIPGKLAGLNAFYNQLAADPQIGAERADELIGALKADAENLVEDVLYPFLAARFAAQVDEAYALWESYGKPSTVSDYDTYFTLRTAFNALEDEILAYFDNPVDAEDEEDRGIGRPELIDPEARAKYEELDVAYQAYVGFRDSFGFSAYEQTELVYASRDVYENDVVKTEPYEVTEEKLLDTIAKIDTFLTSDTFAELVGIEGGLGDLLKGLLTDLLYSDEIVNTIAGLLYPLIYEYIDQGLIDLMGEDIWNQINGLLTDKSEKPISALIERETIVRMTPAGLAAVMPTFDDPKYAAIKTALAGAGKDWQDWHIYNANTGEYNLNWGIDEIEDPDLKEERFFQAMGVALVGVSPLLSVLLCDTPVSVTIKNAASVQILFTINGDMTLELGGNPGYVNALGPIFDILGVTTADGLLTNDQMKAYGKDAANLTNNDASARTRATAVSNILKAVFNPVFAGIDKIMANPLDNVLGILPNVIYALAFNMLPAILKQLRAPIDGIGLVLAGFLDLSSLLAGVLGDGAELNIGDLVDLEDMGLDLSAGLNGILGLLGVDLPAFDEATLATLGTLETKSGSQRLTTIYDMGLAAGEYKTIVADKADVAYYILSYALDLVTTGKLADLLGAFLDEDKLANVDNILGMFELNSTGDAIAALVEVLNAEPYDDAEFSYDNFTGEAGGSLAEIQNDPYTIYWPKWQARYVADNLVTLVENILHLVGDFGENANIGDMLTGLLTDLYTNENIEALTGLVSGLIEDNLDESVMDIINTVAPLVDTVDVNVILEHVKAPNLPEFEDGDRDGFVAALVAYVTPLVPVLKVLLTNDNLELIDGMVTVYGGNGYESGLVPILEAIGCDPANIASYDEFAAAEGEAAVYAVLDPILALVDDLLAKDVDSMLNAVLEIVPNVLYFIENDGLNQAVENLLRPIYVVLDEIRPIINVDLALNFNLAEMLTDLLASAKISLGDTTIVLPSYSELADILYSLGTIETYTSATGKPAKRLVVEQALTPELITYILRYAVDTLLFANNATAVIEWIKSREQISDDQKDYVVNLISSIRFLTTDQVLFVLFQVFFGANNIVGGVDNLVDGYFDLTEYVEGIIAQIQGDFEKAKELLGQRYEEVVEYLKNAGSEIQGNLEQQYNDILEALNNISEATTTRFQEMVDNAKAAIERIVEGFERARDNADQIFGNAQSRFEKFIQQIKDFFQRIVDFFQRLFGGNG